MGELPAREFRGSDGLKRLLGSSDLSSFYCITEPHQSVGWIMGPERFVLVDGNAIAHRALHARMHSIPGARFFTLLCKIIHELDPSYLAIAIDPSRDSLERRKMYKGYKANRKPTEPETRELFDDIWQACRDLGIAVVDFPGWEADDVLGTLSLRASERVHAVIVSSDKDLGQLIDERVHIFDPRDWREVTRRDVVAKFGVEPEQIPDYLAIVGDRVDGIPGVRGLGPRAAIKLLKQYGSLEGLHEQGIWDGGNAAGVGRRFDSLKLYSELTVIRRDLPLTVTTEELRFDGFKKDFLRSSNALRKLRAVKTVQVSGLLHPYP